MTFKPDILKSALSNSLAGGPAKACHFTTLIQPPPIMTAFAYPATVALSTLTEEAQLPGRQFATTPFIMYGTTSKMPYGVIYDDLTLTFICTNNMLERTFFDTWQRLISDPTNNFFNYYDEYVTDIQIIKLRPDGTDLGAPTYITTIEEAYPVTIETQELSWSSENYLQLRVQFAYRRWRNVLDRATASLSSVPGAANVNQVLQDSQLPSVTDAFGLKIPNR